MKRPFLYLLSGLLTVAAIPATIFGSEPPAKEPTRAILVLDASGSMWGKVKGRAKIEIAREVVRDFVAKADPSLHLGLMAYGHRSKGDCDDIELLIEPGPIDKEAFVKTVNGLNPKGKTPLTDAVKQAAAILRFGEEKATVILVSDGLETCGKDPCEAAALLENDGLDFTAHVVGFDLSAEDQKSIRCLADGTGGLFVAANDADSLRKALETVAVETVKAEEPVEEVKAEPVVVQAVRVRLRAELGEKGKAVTSEWTFQAEGSEEEIKVKGESIELPPGKYRATATYGVGSVTQEVEVPNQERFNLTLIYEVGNLDATVSLSGEGDQPGEVRYTVFHQDEEGGRGGKVNDGFRSPTVLFPGSYILEVRAAGTTGEAAFEIKVGETTKVEINLGAGSVEFNLTVGGKPAKDFRIDYFLDEGEGKKGKSVRSALSASASMAAGNYIAVLKWGDGAFEIPFTIEPGKVTKEDFAIPGGWFEFQLTTDKKFSSRYQTERLEPHPGKVTRLLSGDGKSKRAVLAGSYQVTVTVEGEKVTESFEVKAGETTNVQIKR